MNNIIIDLKTQNSFAFGKLYQDIFSKISIFVQNNGRNQADAAAIFTRVSKNVYNQMLLAEAEATGETGSDSDGDGIPYIAGGTKPFVFSESGTLTLSGILGVNIFNKEVFRNKHLSIPCNRFYLSHIA